MKEEEIRKFVRSILKEDHAKRDITSQCIVPKDARLTAVVMAKQDGVLAGADVFPLFFSLLDKSFTCRFFKKDGDRFKPYTKIALIKGRARAVLGAERSALNLIQHMSGIATLTSKFVEKAEKYGVAIADTRKTLPGLRFFEKTAVIKGGGINNRLNLADGILIKDNHIAFAGSVKKAILKVQQVVKTKKRVQIEVTTMGELKEALSCDVNAVLLDNMSLKQIEKAISIVHGRAIIEVSGGVNLFNVEKIAELKPDVISIGSITHSAPAIDISLEVEK